MKLTQATDEDKCVDQTLSICCRKYLSVSTRPDISFAVSSLARFSSKPTTEHWTALKRLFRYLKGTLTQGILYTKDGSSSIIGYTDSDWAGDVNDRKSTSGYNYIFTKWRSQKQKCVALSTAEAEYIAMANAAQKSVWLKQLMAELVNSSDETPTLLYEDNQSAIAIYVKESPISWTCKTYRH